MSVDEKVNASLVEKDPTSLHENYGVWLKEKTGYPVDADAPAEGEEPSEKWTAFIKSIQLAVVCYASFQRSPERRDQKAAEADAKEAREAEAKEARSKAKAEKEAEREAKLQEAAKAKAEKAEAAKAKADAAEGADDAPKTAKAKPAAKTAAKVKVGVEAPF